MPTFLVKDVKLEIMALLFVSNELPIIYDWL